MSLRQRLNDNPRVVAIAAGAVVLVALVLMLWPGTAGGGKAAGVTKEFYSVDDGRSWFAAEAGKLPPFDKDGKPAHRVRVYRCAHGKEFVSHLERYSDADRARMQKLIDEKKTRSMEFIQLESGFEMKKPGGGQWLKPTAQNIAQANAMRTPKCPEGSTAGLTRVSPE